MDYFNKKEVQFLKEKDKLLASKVDNISYDLKVTKVVMMKLS